MSKNTSHKTLKQQTLVAAESALQGKVISAYEVHKWLSSWGTGNELEAPKFKTSTDMLKD